jgi:hypothetical protein
MIYAKINPPVSMPVMGSPFSAPTFVTGSYLTAKVENYKLGAERAEVRAFFGYPIEQEGQQTEWKTLHAESIVVSKDFLDNWGTDDTVVLEEIANQKGIEIVEVIEVPDSDFRNMLF